MRGFWSWLAVAIAASVMAGCGGSGNTKAGSPAPKGTTLRLHSTQAAFVPMFQSKRGFQPGDQFIYTSRVDHGGNEEVLCVISPRKFTVFVCTVTFDLPKGQIVASGIAPQQPREAYSLPVIGGSGAYDGARGSLRTTGAGRRGEFVTIRLR